MPSPQINEKDLEEIVKMGVSGDVAREMVTGSETLSTQLLGPDGFRAPTPMRTARVLGETDDDVIKTMARNTSRS